MPTKYAIITKQDTDEVWNPVSVIGESEVSDPVVLGSKGAGLNEMVKLGLPVPDGFTIHTEACVAYQLKPKGTYWRIKSASKRAYKELKKRNGGIAPIVSVRSGAEKSMPGMLSTVLNVGLTSKTFPKLVKLHGEKTAFDCKRRLLQSYGAVVFGIANTDFEFDLSAAREYENVGSDGELSVKTLEKVCAKFESTFALYGHELPDTIEAQLTTAIRAVFESWNNPEAIEWRKINGIPEDGGTAVNVQTMVFGNLNEHSGTGVLFSRDPATGEDKIYGEWMSNAQGDDLVSGVRTPDALSVFRKSFKNQYSELRHRAKKLEKHYRDMRDIEFTVMDGKLWMLQDRAGKRSDEAAARIAVELVESDTLTRAEAIRRISTEIYAKLRGSSKVVINPDFKVKPVAKGLNASPGIVTGRIALTAGDAIELAKIGPVILVRSHTETSDIAGMDAAVGVLTATGGVTSHAAVCSRALNTACVVGCADILAKIAIDDPTIITLDGSTGNVWFDTDVPTTATGTNEHIEKLVDWAFMETGAARWTPVLTGPRQRIMCASWLTSVEDRVKSFETLAAMDSPETVVFDLSGPGRFSREEDEGLTTMFGEGGAAIDDSEMHMVLTVMAAIDGRGSMLYLPGALTKHAEHMKAAGYKVALDVQTVADMYAADGLITIDDEVVEKVFGGHPAFSETISLLIKTGKPVNVLQPAVSEEEIVNKTFGKDV